MSVVYCGFSGPATHTGCNRHGPIVSHVSRLGSLVVRKAHNSYAFPPSRSIVKQSCHLDVHYPYSIFWCQSFLIIKVKNLIYVHYPLAHLLSITRVGWMMDLNWCIIAVAFYVQLKWEKIMTNSSCWSLFNNPGNYKGPSLPIFYSTIPNSDLCFAFYVCSYIEH